MPPLNEADTIRILVATDNHVGFEERDPIRKDDSWRSFDEVLQLAKSQDVDMVLLGGDLFHDNKPSRKAMYQVMRSLRKNCLGEKPCELEFLSDANEVFEGAFGHVNYEDPDINISIPVFSIHGNHDDPSGDGHFCSLDLLQVAGLVNYFGRIPEADNIQARPILLQKGRTKLALYGLSNVRDERMFRTFRDHKVKWLRPSMQRTDWFNLLTVHQNHHAHTATGYLPENVLPDWMNLVVWGHEHECLIDPSKNPETGFHVMQPGSSVATSLVAGEAVTKHVAIVSISGRDFQVEKIPLKTVRPLVTREIVLANDRRFKGLDKKKENRQELTKKLIEIVEEMIEEANNEWLSLQDGVDELEPDEQPLPLIRLKVEYTPPTDGGKYDCENPQRFSNRFVGKVANTNDVVYFYRKKTAQSRKDKADGQVPEGVADFIELDDVRVDALVEEFLIAQSLKVLPQAPFGDAVKQFVNKDDRHAMETFVSEQLAGQVKEMLRLDPEEDIDSAMERIRAQEEAKFAAGLKKHTRRVYRPRPEDWDSDMDGAWEDQPQALEESAPQAQQPSAPLRGRRTVSMANDDDEDIFMDDAPAQPAKKAPAKRAAKTRTTKAEAAPKKAAPARKPPARGRKKAGPFVDEDEDEDEGEDVFVDENEGESGPQPKRGAAAKSQNTQRTQPTRASTRAKQTTLNFGSQRSSQRPSQRQTALEISDDEISEEDAFESMPTTRSTRRR